MLTKIYYSRISSFPDVCYADGLYLLDADRFVQCDSGRAYVKQCAYGSKNAASYEVGAYVTFCGERA